MRNKLIVLFFIFIPFLSSQEKSLYEQDLENEKARYNPKNDYKKEEPQNLSPSDIEHRDIKSKNDKRKSPQTPVKNNAIPTEQPAELTQPVAEEEVIEFSSSKSGLAVEAKKTLLKKTGPSKLKYKKLK